jgi:hypothetical protein
MMAVTLGSLRRMRAVRSLTAVAISAFSDGEARTLEYVIDMSGIVVLLRWGAMASRCP